MVNKNYNHELKLIVKNNLKLKVCKLLEDTRTHSVKSQFVVMDDMSQQDSIVYSWVFKTIESAEEKKATIIQRLASQYIDDYLMVVT